MRRSLIAAFASAGFLLAGPCVAAENIEGLARTCNNCHGVDGVSSGESMPSIGGLPEAYLKKVMLEWKEGKRFSATMGRLIKGYTDEEITALSKHFAALPWQPVTQETDVAKVEKGQQASKTCGSCHGATGMSPRSDVPPLSGQWSRYLDLEMQKYHDQEVDMPALMRNFVRRIPAEDTQAIGEFYADQDK